MSRALCRLPAAVLTRRRVSAGAKAAKAPVARIQPLLPRPMLSATSAGRAKGLATGAGRPGQAPTEEAAPAPTWTDAEVEAGIKKWQAHEKKAPFLPLAEQARTLVDAGRSGVLSCISVLEASAGFPFGQVTNFASDDMGRPLFALSSKLSPQFKNLAADPRCSLAVTSGEFASLADARLNLIGEATLVKGEEKEAVREAFRAKHPDAYYIDFGDFEFLRMDKIVEVRYVGGFGRVGQCAGHEYMAAKSDPVAKFTGPVAGHMNADHAESISAMLTSAIGCEVSDAEIVAIDRLGMDCRASLFGDRHKMRLPFPRPAEDRKDLKTLIVEMSRPAAAQEGEEGK